jgi:hypothetical protein
MNDTLMRRVLRTTAVLNFGAALLFAFPASLGQLAGLPAPAPPLYTTFLALLIALFGATYAWLANQAQIDRPLVAFCALGKTGFVVVALGCWLFADLPSRAVLLASGDLVFAALFAWWLMSASAAPQVSTSSRAA